MAHLTKKNKGHNLRKYLVRLVSIAGLVTIIAFSLGCGNGQTTGQSQAADQSKSTSSAPPTDQSQSSAALTYNADIAPLLSANCVKCHNPNGREKSLPLDTYANVMKYVTPGKPDNSELIEAVDSGEMSGRLTGDQLQVLTEWVLQGAKK